MHGPPLIYFRISGRHEFLDLSFLCLNSQTQVQRLHRTAVEGAGTHLLWVMDRFDAAVQQLDSQTLNSLRSLRDQFKGQLCYLFVTRHPLARLREPSEFDELHEIVAANTCWLQPLVYRDVRWILETQMAERLGTNFEDTETSRMAQLTGGLPAFIKFIAIAYADKIILDADIDEVWCRTLLSRREFQRNCKEIWADLTAGEQNVLKAIAYGEDVSNLDLEIVEYLFNCGLLKDDGGKTDLFSPIFSRYIVSLSGESSGAIGFNSNTHDVTRNGASLNIELTRQEEMLLAYFLSHSGEVARKEEIIGAVWPDEEIFDGIRDDRLAQLIKRLREKIEPVPARPIYIQTVRGRGYRFEQPN